MKSQTEIQEDTIYKSFDKIMSQLLSNGLIPDDLLSRKRVWDIFTEQALHLASRSKDSHFDIEDIRNMLDDVSSSVENARMALDDLEQA